MMTWTTFWAAWAFGFVVQMALHLGIAATVGAIKWLAILDR